MATVVSRNVTVWAGPEEVVEVVLNSLTAGQSFTVSYNGMFIDGGKPEYVDFAVTTPPTDGSVPTLAHTASNTTTNNVTVKFDCPPGGSLDGMVVKLKIHFVEKCSGGLAVPA